MGRIKTAKIKRICNDIVRMYGDKLKEDYNENKEILPTLVDIPSKKLRNVVVGYTTRLVQIRNKEAV